MDGPISGRRRVVRFAVALALAAVPFGCRESPGVGDLPTPGETLRRAGVRLSRSHSAAELTRIAARGDRVLRALDATERDALARGALRFEVDRPAVVSVAAPPGSEPFWLGDLGFRPVPLRLDGPDGRWHVWQRRFGAGAVGLGVNALDRTAPAHYAVLVQAEDGSPLAPASVRGEGWRVATAEAGVSLASDVSLPLRGLDPALRGAALLQPAHDRRHDALLARCRVWKTHAEARRAPDQIAVLFGADAGTELVWTWRTAPGAARSVVELAPLPAGGSTPDVGVRKAEGEAHAVETPELLNDPVNLRHKVRVAGLEPSTAYAYRVSDGTPEGTSPWFPVRTGPGPGDDVHLLYMGDPQCGLEGWGRLLARARRSHPEANALLIAGDLVDRGNERSNWDHFFLRASGVFEGLPVMPAVGNHEYLDRGPRLYRANFAPPGNGPEGVGSGLVYAFECGDALVAVLDSTLAVSHPAEARRQAEWLDALLAASPRRWKLVMFHHPVYASHPSRENLALRDAWVPVFDRHRVDLVLQGHDHAYLRTYPMRGGRAVATPAEGTVYVVSVSGNKYYDQDPRGYAAVGFTGVSTYQTLDLRSAEGRLVYRAWNDRGEEVDRVEMLRPSAAADVAGRLTSGR